MFVKFYDLVLCTLFTLNSAIYRLHLPAQGLQGEISNSAKTWYNASLLVIIYKVNVSLYTVPV